METDPEMGLLGPRGEPVAGGDQTKGPAAGPPGAQRANIVVRARDATRDWLLRRRRRRASRRRTTGRRAQVVLAIFLLILLGGYAWAWLVYMKPDPRGEEVSLNELSALADARRIETAEFLDEDSVVTGTFAAAEAAPVPARTGPASDKARASQPSPSPPPDATDAPEGEGTYWAPYPTSDAVTAQLVEMVTAAGAEVSLNPQSTKQAARVAATFLLPLMILANLFALLFSASKGGGSAIGEVMTFGTIGKGRYKRKGAPAVSFSDVAGADEAVAELKEVRDYLANPKKYADIGAAPPKGVLLVGPPGCGKTLLAKAVAGEAGVPFFSVAGAEFVESLVGVGAARVRDLFARVRAVAPAIVFIDELDAAGRRRGHGGGSGGSDEREQTLNQLLVEMDGFDVSQGIVVIAATNRPDILDPALLRPGRFDRHVTMDQPDQEGRRLILELHARGKPMASSVDFERLAKRTPGFSGADLANVINESALLSLREGKPEIEMPELEEAIQRVLAGPKKKGRVLSEEEKRRAAYHESGHAIVAGALGRTDEVHRVSILARGRGLGLAGMRRESDAVLQTTSELFAQIVIAMSGMASESLVLGEASTGAEQDLERATEVAQDMIGRFGMGSRRRRLLAKDADEFLGVDAGLSSLSQQTHQEMEDEVDRLLKEAERQATRLLQDNRTALDALASRLVDEEHLEGADLERLLAGVKRAELATAASVALGNGQVVRRRSRAKTQAGARAEREPEP